MTVHPQQPAFIGARLAQARTARGWTAVALAEEVGVTPASISAYERKRVTPRPAVEAQLCAKLGLPAAFFRRPCLTDQVPARYRSLASATKRARAAAEARAVWLREIVLELQRWVDLPSPTLPHLDLPRDPVALSDDDIERAADATRRAWNMGDGPIDNVARLLEAHGIIVSRFSFGVPNLDAFSLAHRDRPYIVMNTERESCARGRFDAAHELAHLILHRHAPERPSAELHKLLERQAHRFAQAFLFPLRAFLDEVFTVSLDALVIVKERWRVSIGTMLMRAKHLGVASPHQVERVWPIYSRRGWRTREPLDDVQHVERPALLRQTYELVLSEGGLGRGDLLRALPFSTRDHETLAGLPHGYMESTWAEADVVPLVRLPERRSHETGDARIIPFRRQPD